MRSLTVLALLVGSVAVSPTAHAEDCKASRRKLQSVVRSFEAAAAKTSDLWLQCLYTGPDSKAEAKLEADARRALLHAMKLVEPPASCVKAGSFSGGIGALANAIGQRFGLAWSTCSPAAQGRVAELRAAGKSDEEIQAEIGAMSEQWFRSLLR